MDVSYLNSLTLGFSCVVWLKLDFDVFRYFIIISPWKMALTLHFSSPKDALCQVWLKLAEWFWWRRFLNYTKLLVFSLFPHYRPLEKSMALHLNKLESPLPQDAWCQVWLKLSQRFRRRFKNFVNVFCYSVIISPWKWAWHFIWTILDALCQVGYALGHMVTICFPWKLRDNDNIFGWKN